MALGENASVGTTPKRDAIFETAVAAGLGPVKEGHFLLPGNDRRPADVLVPNWTGGKDAAMDVKVTTPIKVTTMPGAANTAGFALDHAHKGKLDGAEEACRRQGLAFLPLVAETFGGWHPSAQREVKKLGSALARHRAGRGRGSLPPLGEAGHLTPTGERGNTGKPGTSSAGPPNRQNHVNSTLFFHCL